MKSAMPYYGVPVPAVRRLTRTLASPSALPDAASWETAVRRLYDEAAFREERYAALAIAGHKPFRAYATRPSMALWKHLVVTGAWWDLVDETAHRVGDVLLAHRERAAPVIVRWSTARELWLRRISIICQLGHKAETDTSLLAATIDANAGDPEFFIRKAIGWALREYARTDPTFVRDFVSSRDLSPLSRREAMKHLPEV